MKKWLKVMLFLASAFVILIIALNFWIERKLEKIINSNPERNYDIEIAETQINFTLNGATFESLHITPRSASLSKTWVTGSVEKAQITGLRWHSLLLSNSLIIDQLKFDNPDFTLFIDSTQANSNSGKSFQDFFKDILYRASMNDFIIQNGRVNAFNVGKDTTLRGEIQRIHIKAEEIITDLVRSTHIIPFEVGRIQTNFNGISYFPDSMRNITVEYIDSDSRDTELRVDDFRLSLTRNWVEVSRNIGVQKDIFEIVLNSLNITGLDTNSSFYDSLNLHASSITIDSLTLTDHRNKNIPRPPEPEKPLFRSMIDSIPFPVTVDSLLLSNSTIIYKELGEGKSAHGELVFNDLKGQIYNITNDPVRQARLEGFAAHFTGQVNNQGRLRFDLDVPYPDNTFVVEANIQKMNMKALNSTLMPLADVKVNNGIIHDLNIRITADENQAQCRMKLDYQDLNVSILTEDKNEIKDMGFLSRIANSAVRKSHIPGDKNYTIPTYITQRNLQRGPFNYIWKATKDGFAVIVPSKTATLFIKDKK
jgi:hypothetical protein